MSAIFRLLTGDESGQDLVEYALLSGFIALVCVAGVTAFGRTVQDTLWGPVAAAVEDAFSG